MESAFNIGNESMLEFLNDKERQNVTRLWNTQIVAVKSITDHFQHTKKPTTAMCFSPSGSGKSGIKCLRM
jgi:hypothetical protein